MKGRVVTKDPLKLRVACYKQDGRCEELARIKASRVRGPPLLGHMKGKHTVPILEVSMAEGVRAQMLARSPHLES